MDFPGGFANTACCENECRTNSDSDEYREYQSQPASEGSGPAGCQNRDGGNDKTLTAATPGVHDVFLDNDDAGSDAEDDEIEIETKTGMPEHQVLFIESVKKKVDDGSIMISRSHWVCEPPSTHNNNQRPDPLSYGHVRAVGVWDPDRVHGRSLSVPCPGSCCTGRMQRRAWVKRARRVHTANGDFWWLITVDYSCHMCNRRLRATTDEFLNQMEVFDRAAFTVFLAHSRASTRPSRSS